MKKLTLLISICFCYCTCVLSQNNDSKFGTIKVRKYQEQQFFIELKSVPKYIDGADTLLDDIQKGIIYPEAAKAQKFEGTVLVKIIIDKYGNVINTSIHSSPHVELNSSAMTAAKRLRKFEPHLVNDLVVPAQFILPIQFILPL